MADIRGVLLDVDGTLVDSNWAHAEAWSRAMHEFGFEVPTAQIMKLVGMGGDNLLPAAINLEKDTPTGKAMSTWRSELFMREYLPNLRPFPRTRELLERMRLAGLQLVVASSAQEEELKPLLEIAGATDLIKAKTSADDAPRSKPDPDIIEAALRELGLPPTAAVLLGDTPYDIEAAGKAGVSTVAVRCGGWRTADLRAALAIYDDPADLLARFDKSPLGGGRALGA